MNFQIKPEYQNQPIGFNNSGAPLGHRNDLLDFAILAREANDGFLLGMFQGEVPSLEDLRKEKAKQLQAPGTVLPVAPKLEENNTATPSAKEDPKK